MDVDHYFKANHKLFSGPGFLGEVFKKELRNYSGHNHKLLVIALHAGLLDCGFVRFDKNANVVVNGLCYPADVWPTLSLYYTLPEIGTAHTVVLKFQSIGKCMTIYGSLNGGGKTHKVVLTEEQLAAFQPKYGIFLETYMQKKVFELLWNVKDNLAFPLLIDICEKAGLGVPPCFMSLPTDIKLKIMELLSVEEIENVSCTCSELRCLASSDELWKIKFIKTFGEDAYDGEESWKMAFVSNRDLMLAKESLNMKICMKICSFGRETRPYACFGGGGRDYRLAGARAGRRLMF